MTTLVKGPQAAGRGSPFWCRLTELHSMQELHSMLYYDDAACRNPIESAVQTDPPRGWDQRRLFVCGAVMWMVKSHTHR